MSITTHDKSMTSSRPYLIRAMYDWIVDNGLTPYLAVNVNHPGVQVPKEHANEGIIILNISPKASRGLHLLNDRIVFSTRFSGVITQICVPPLSVTGIYAKENGRGLLFSEEEEGVLPPTPPETFPTKKVHSLSASTKAHNKPKLTVVKGGSDNNKKNDVE